MNESFVSHVSPGKCVGMQATESCNRAGDDGVNVLADRANENSFKTLFAFKLKNNHFKHVFNIPNSIDC